MDSNSRDIPVGALQTFQLEGAQNFCETTVYRDPLDILNIVTGFRTTTIVLLVTWLLQAQSTSPGSTARSPNPAAAIPQSSPFVTCPAGSPLGAVEMRVKAGDQTLPFRTINHLSEGDGLLYAPILRGKEKRPGEVALVLVPETREPGKQDILVTDPKPADKAQEWKITQTISLAALVYGPAGLSRKKVAKFLSRDEVLIAQLADYADKTAQAEQLVATLSNSESSSASMNAALSGFASEYGFAVQLDKNAPVQRQAATLFAAMNPQLASYNPLTSSTAQKAGQTASLATMAGALFFGSPVGLAAGGTAMLLDLRSIAFPDTQFRPSFAQPLAGSGISLCGQQGPVPPHTRVAYLWASRVPNISTPTIRVGEANFVPATQKSPLPVDVPEPGWKYLDRAREWSLAGNEKKVSIPVVKLGNQHALEIDLTKANLSPGDYKLTAFWDWATLQATGTVHVLPLSDFKQAHLDRASQDHLLAKSGKVPVTVTGSDFEFTTKVEVQKLNDEFATAESVRFLLPKGLRKGPQDHMDVQLDTESLDAGAYKLLISQQDGKSHPVEFKVLPNPPKFTNLPILVNPGAATQHFVLKGERLEQLSKLEATGVTLKLSPPDANREERSLTVQLNSSPSPGAALAVKAYVENRSEPLTLSDALEITGPLPVIASSKLSLPKGMAIAIHPEEFPAGYTLNAVLDVKNIERQSVLRLACADGVGERAALHIGEQANTWNLQQLSPDQLFLAFDTSRMPAGCSLQAVIDNGRDGSSQPFTLAHILRLPQIDSLTLTDTPPQKGTRQYQLNGRNLEMIEKLGWDDHGGVAVTEPPTPLPGPGLKQSIQFMLPDPPTSGTLLRVWLRGDKQGRETTVKAPEMPQPVPTAITVTSSLDATYPGQTVTFVAKVTPTEATGTVTFMADHHSIGSAMLSAGQATLTTSSLSAGSMPITAEYGGDTKFGRSTSPALMQKVNKGTTATSIRSAPNPSVAGQEVTFTAVVTVTSSTGGSPTGTVTFTADNTVMGSGTLDSGTATFTLSTMKAGKYNVTAVYNGSPAFEGSTSAVVTHVVQ